MAGRVLVAYGSKFDREPASDVRSLDAYLAMARKTAPELRDRGERRAIDAWSRGIAAALTG
jgi:hypothetical protein